MPRYITYSDNCGFGPVRNSLKAAELDSIRNWKHRASTIPNLEAPDKVYAVDGDGYLRDASGTLVYSGFPESAKKILLRIDKDAIGCDEGAYDKIYDELSIEDASNLEPIRLPDGLWYFKVLGEPFGPFKTPSEVELAINQAIHNEEMKISQQYLRESSKPAWLVGLLELTLLLLLALIVFQLLK